MKRAHAFSYPVSIFIAGDADKARSICQEYCDEVGYCVTVTPTDYIFRNGTEPGVIVGLINYPRFPAEPADISAHAEKLALRLIAGLGQKSASVQSPLRTAWFSFREEDQA